MSIPFDSVRRWTFETCLPFWAEQGFDPEAEVFRERLTVDGRPEPVGYRRTRVMARQIYVFSHAALMGWTGPALERARATHRYMTDKAWLGAGQGWARRVNEAGEVIDPTADLYDHAFALYALAWLHKADPTPETARQISQTLDFIETGLAAEDGLGFAEAADHPAGTRLQNPHMHMLEALTIAADATGDERYADKARQVFSLFRDRFFDHDRMALREVFGPGWTYMDNEEGRLTEPGHQMEWAWLLRRYGDLTGDPVSPMIHALVEFAETRGVCPDTGLTYDGVSVDGAVVKGSFRLWPQTETLKGHLAVFEDSGQSNPARIAQICDNILSRYLDTEPAGVWTEQLDEAARPAHAFTPASSLYHVFLAFAELIRLEPVLRKAAA